MTKHSQTSSGNDPTGPVSVAESTFQRDGDRAYIVATYIVDDIKPLGISDSTHSRIVTRAINDLGVVLSSLPPGSEISLVMGPSTDLGKRTTRLLSAPKQRKKNSTRTSRKNSKRSKKRGKRGKRAT